MENTETVSSIMDAFRQLAAGYLWVCTHNGAEEAILWPTEESSVNDDGAKAVQRWQLTAEEAEILAGIASETNL